PLFVFCIDFVGVDLCAWLQLTALAHEGGDGDAKSRMVTITSFALGTSVKRPSFLLSPVNPASAKFRMPGSSAQSLRSSSVSSLPSHDRVRMRTMKRPIMAPEASVSRGISFDMRCMRVDILVSTCARYFLLMVSVSSPEMDNRRSTTTLPPLPEKRTSEMI